MLFPKAESAARALEGIPRMETTGGNMLPSGLHLYVIGVVQLINAQIFRVAVIGYHNRGFPANGINHPAQIRHNTTAEQAPTNGHTIKNASHADMLPIYTPKVNAKIWLLLLKTA